MISARMHRFAIHGLMALLLCGVGSAAEDPAAAWVPLFNGRDLSGWQTKGNWVVEPGGVVTLRPRPGESGWSRFGHYLWSEKTFANFELECEFQTTGDSGVLFHVADPLRPGDLGCELQVTDDPSCGSLYDFVGDDRAASVKAQPHKDQWNRLLLRVRGRWVQCELNGVEVCDVLRSAASSILCPTGYIGFQDFGKSISYRNVRIRDLTGTPAADLALVPREAVRFAEPIKLQIVPAHAWMPPFGLDRLDRTTDALITTRLDSVKTGEFSLVGYGADGKEAMRTALVMQKPVVRTNFPSDLREVAVVYDRRDGTAAIEFARAAVPQPAAFEAEAAARTQTVIHPLDLGTIFVPHGALLLTKGHRALVEVAALTRSATLASVRISAWYESDPGQKKSLTASLDLGRIARTNLDLGVDASNQKQDVLHVVIEDSAGKQLWQKNIRVLRVPNPPRNPSFGAVATKLRYDLPIPVRTPDKKLTSIDYDTAWDPKFEDIVVFLPNGARFVLWRGASYCTFWASRANTGLSYQWAEMTGSYQTGAVDCVDISQDKELRISRAEIVESTKARVHVRWSYQPCDLNLKVFGDRATEDYYFYPDGLGTRMMTIAMHPQANIETSEFIMFTPPGAYPHDILPKPFIEYIRPDRTIPITFPWQPEKHPEDAAVLGAIRDSRLLYRVHFGRGDPLAAIFYSASELGANSHGLPGFWAFYDQGCQVSPMYWGNHLPLSRGFPTGWEINDRIALGPGSCSSIHPGTPRPLRSRTGEMRDGLGVLKPMKEHTYVWLIGMTDANDQTLRRWMSAFSTKPPALDLVGAEAQPEPYALERRALRLVVKAPTVSITIKPATSYVNPVFELRDAPGELKGVSLDGRALEPQRYAWDGKTLWIEAAFDQPATLRLEFGG